MRARVSRYSLREVANATGLHVETVRRAARAGRLATMRSPSGYYHFATLDAVTDWLRRYSPSLSPGAGNPPISRRRNPVDGQ